MKLLLLVCAIGFASCANLGPRFSEPKTFNKRKSLVHIYRVNRFMGAAISPYICIDGKTVGELPNGSYLSLELKPGRHELYKKNLGTEMNNFSFKTQAGRVYYLRNDLTLDNGAKENMALAGGGAIGAIMGKAFESGQDVEDRVVKNLDRRAQGKTKNPGFLAVKPSFAKAEIVKTKQFIIPKYEKNYCARERDTKK